MKFRSLVIAMGLMGGGFCAPTHAYAEPHCLVADPTGTPLNVRTTPNGKTVSTLPNGQRVRIIEQSAKWVYVSEYDTDQPLGWVFRKFITCAEKKSETGNGLDCYARVYDQSHLAKHPEQLVKSMQLGFRAQPENPGHYDFVIAVTVRGQNNHFVTGDTCSPSGERGFRCGIACDRGSFKLGPSSRKGSVRLELDRIYFDEGCGVDDGRGFELTAGKDDRIFRLDPSPKARCDSLFEILGQQGAN